MVISESYGVPFDNGATDFVSFAISGTEATHSMSARTEGYMKEPYQCGDDQTIRHLPAPSDTLGGTLRRVGALPLRARNTMANRSPLILPPGVVSQGQPAASGVPFNRDFFESVLPGAIQSYCTQVACTMPLVQLFTSDGSRHYIRAISAVSDLWVALHTQEELDEQPIQMFIPYVTIIRIEIHPDLTPDLRKFGFITAGMSAASTAIPATATEPSE